MKTGPMILMVGLVASGLAGCRSFPRTATPNQAGAFYPLLAPATYGRSLDVEQLFDSEFDGRRNRLRVHVAIDSHQIRMVGVSPISTRVFVLRYDGRDISLEPPGEGHLPFAPQAILSDFQLVFWPALPARGGWTIREDPVAGMRRVFHEGTLVADVYFPRDAQRPNEYRLVNHRYGYRLTIRNLPGAAG